ncbi:hypothetical protein AVEN_205956-1 [Araneus ventricosus]|uniref:Uncharacterized protein n=1 Tax=Araneus ventricosus TaxID=182803 RepID=A0A4Y2SJT2_ARAVE|nr:hypothetical protein AVEN_205956-1 [Araneus ventricosus]
MPLSFTSDRPWERRIPQRWILRITSKSHRRVSVWQRHLRTVSLCGTCAAVSIIDTCAVSIVWHLRNVDDVMALAYSGDCGTCSRSGVVAVAYSGDCVALVYSGKCVPSLTINQ